MKKLLVKFEQRLIREGDGIIIKWHSLLSLLARNRARITVIFTILTTTIVFYNNYLDNKIDASFNTALAKANTLNVLNSTISADTSNQYGIYSTMVDKGCYINKQYDNCIELEKKYKAIYDNVEVSVKQAEVITEEFKSAGIDSNWHRFKYD